MFDSFPFQYFFLTSIVLEILWKNNSDLAAKRKHKNLEVSTNIA